MEEVGYGRACGIIWNELEDGQSESGRTLYGRIILRFLQLKEVPRLRMQCSSFLWKKASIGQARRIKTKSQYGKKGKETFYEKGNFYKPKKVKSKKIESKKVKSEKSEELSAESFSYEDLGRGVLGIIESQKTEIKRLEGLYLSSRKELGEQIEENKKIIEYNTKLKERILELNKELNSKSRRTLFLNDISEMRDNLRNGIDVW